MKFTTRTEYGLNCLVFLTRRSSADLTTIREIVKREEFSSSYVEKILQDLRNAEIVTSHKGKDGGYALARAAEEINLREIIEALEGSTFDIYCQPEIRKNIVCTHTSMCGIRPLWERTKALLDRFFDDITLETLAQEEERVVQLLPSIEMASKPARSLNRSMKSTNRVAVKAGAVSGQ